MVLFVDGFPDAWFGKSFLVNSQRITVAGVVNGETLTISNQDKPPVPFMNVRGFAKGLLLGYITHSD